ncbi:MAG: hypothetical protein KBC95_03095 [Candidatus Peribacteraceae bacterium]|nr:hypothetical protein [Candidatus Peribacteraceae bacterium]
MSHVKNANHSDSRHGLQGIQRRPNFDERLTARGPRRRAGRRSRAALARLGLLLK